MNAVFIHGVPDTYRVWDKVRAQLPSVTTVALSLPGFGSPLPEGFAATKEAYVGWIIEQLERLEPPVHLVGHDWGAILALRVASLRPQLVHTLAAGNGPVSRNYQWHRVAQIWQTPGEGESFMQSLDILTLTQILQTLHVDPADAVSAASHLDGRMKDSILKLYRSAAALGDEWEPGLSAIASPTLIYWGNQDAECPVPFAYELARFIPGACVEEVDCKHWVPLHRPAALATLLLSHWGQHLPGSSARAGHTQNRAAG